MFLLRFLSGCQYCVQFMFRVACTFAYLRGAASVIKKSRSILAIYGARGTKQTAAGCESGCPVGGRRTGTYREVQRMPEGVRESDPAVGPEFCEEKSETESRFGGGINRTPS